MADIYVSKVPNSVKIGTGSAITGCVGVSGGDLEIENDMIHQDDDDFERDGGRVVFKRSNVELQYADGDAVRDSFTVGATLDPSLVLVQGGYGGQSGATVLDLTRTIVKAKVLAIRNTEVANKMGATLVILPVSADGATDPITEAYA